MRNFKGRTYRVPSPDPVYRSRLVALLINMVMKNGKKTLAQKLVYKAFRKVLRAVDEDEKKCKDNAIYEKRHSLKKFLVKGQKNPALLLERCVKRLQPLVILRVHRWRGGRGRKGHLYRMSVYKKACFSLKWIILGAKCRTKSGRNFPRDLSEEIISLIKGKGNALKLRDGLDATVKEFFHHWYRRLHKDAPDSKTNQLEWYLRTSKYRAKKKMYLKSKRKRFLK